MRLARPFTLLALVAATGLALGCGNGDDSGGAPDGAARSDGGLAEEAAAPVTGMLTVVADAAISTTSEPCAAAVSLTAAPDNVSVGHSITLAASGLDPSDQSGDVILTWSVTGSAGSLGSSTGPTVTFTCTSMGTASVQVTAAMDDGGATCPATGSLTTVLSCTAP